MIITIKILIITIIIMFIITCNDGDDTAEREQKEEKKNITVVSMTYHQKNPHGYKICCKTSLIALFA